MSAAAAAFEFDLVGESTDSSSGPVYVYGESGRCWKFSNLTNAENYFKHLNRYPVSAEIGLWLNNKYGSNFVSRLSKMSKLAKEKYGSHTIYDDSKALNAAVDERNAKRRRQIISEPIEYAVYITNTDGTITKEYPTKWKHTLKPVNMIVYSTLSEFSSGDVTAIADIFIQEFLSEHNDVEQGYYEYYTLYTILASMENELLLDYLRGDRIVYSSPRRAHSVATTRTWNPLRFLEWRRSTREEDAPLIVDIS